MGTSPRLGTASIKKRRIDMRCELPYPISIMFAIIQTGGKQYLVKQGDVLNVEKLAVELGQDVSLETLLIAEEDGSSVTVGTPVLPQSVIGEVVAHGRGDKISVVKYKPKVRYRKRVGHRQWFTTVKIKLVA